MEDDETQPPGALGGDAPPGADRKRPIPEHIRQLVDEFDEDEEWPISDDLQYLIDNLGESGVEMLRVKEVAREAQELNVAAEAFLDNETFGRDAAVSAAFLSARAARITSLSLLESLSIAARVEITLSKLSVTSARVALANSQLVSTSSKVNAVNERIERLHKPRGIILLGTLIVLSNLVAGLALILSYLALSEIFAQVAPSRAFAEGLAGSFIAAFLIAALTYVGRKVARLIRED